MHVEPSVKVVCRTDISVLASCCLVQLKKSTLPRVVKLTTPFYGTHTTIPLPVAKPQVQVSPLLGGPQLTKRDRLYEAPIKADWSEEGPCTLVR